MQYSTSLQTENLYTPKLFLTIQCTCKHPTKFCTVVSVRGIFFSRLIQLPVSIVRNVQTRHELLNDIETAFGDESRDRRAYEER